MTVFLQASRFFSPIEVDCETVEEAIGIAFWSREYNDAWPIEVTDEEGLVIVSSDQLEAAMRSKADAYYTRLA